MCVYREREKNYESMASLKSDNSDKEKEFRKGSILLE